MQQHDPSLLIDYLSALLAPAFSYRLDMILHFLLPALSSGSIKTLAGALRSPACTLESLYLETIDMTTSDGARDAAHAR